MKFDKRLRPELCASKDDTRLNITEPYLSGNSLIATTGKLMLVMPVESEPEDIDGYLPAAVIQAARKEGPARGLLQVQCRESYALPSGATLPRSVKLDGMKFPDWEACLPTAPRKLTVCLHADSLTMAAKAMGSEWLTLEIAEVDTPIIVRPDPRSPEPKAFCVVMPRKVT